MNFHCTIDDDQTRKIENQDQPKILSIREIRFTYGQSKFATFQTETSRSCTTSHLKINCCYRNEIEILSKADFTLFDARVIPPLFCFLTHSKEKGETIQSCTISII